MKYKIWSLQYRCWWSPNQSGYTYSHEKAGIYDKETAINICFGANSFIDVEIPFGAMVPIKERENDNE